MSFVVLNADGTVRGAGDEFMGSIEGDDYLLIRSDRAALPGPAW